MERHIQSYGPNTKYSHHAVWMSINMAVIWNAIELFVTGHVPTTTNTFDLLLRDLDTHLNVEDDTRNNSYFFFENLGLFDFHISQRSLTVSAPSAVAVTWSIYLLFII